MLYSLIVFGTFWFWFLMALEVGWLICCAARECKAWQSLISILLFLGVLQCFSDVNILLLIWYNPITVLLLLGLYLFGGCIWVFPKWWLFCKDHLRKYIDLRDKFLTEKKLFTGTNIPETEKDAWQEYYSRNNTYYEDCAVFKPEPSKYKNRIITWMTLWPLSFLWTMLNDPIVRFFRAIYYEISGVLRRISDNVFKDVSGDFDKEKKEI